MTDDRTGDADDSPEADPPRRRRHRRAVGGTRPAEPEAAEPKAPRDVEDTDRAWGGRDEGDDDERFLREVPPHW